MGFINQKPRAADFLISEANGQRSRENILIGKTTKALFAGQLLATAEDGSYTPYEGPGTTEKPISVSGVLYAGVPASTTPQPGVGVVRDAEVATALLIGLDESAVVGLESLGILTR